MEAKGVADYLLKEGLLLTALELHAELLERGRGLTCLAKFFEDPSNFETVTRTSPSSSLCGGGSQATLDDLSLFDAATRYSEDSHAHGVDDRVAVLEFELRKARETVNSLREELTQQASQTPREEVSQCNSASKDVSLTKEPLNEDASLVSEDEPVIRAHEQRAVNFLVNEYLLQYGYKLTSITFSDENPDADDYFEDWDCIGLNVVKPPNLLKLFRDYGRHFVQVVPKEVMDNCSQTIGQDNVASLHKKLDQSLLCNHDLQQEVERALKSKEEEEMVLKSTIEKLQLDLQEAITKQKLKTEPHEVLVEVKPTDVVQLKCLPSGYEELIATWCPYHSVQQVEEDRIITSEEDFIETLSKSLPNIVPNVLLAKRDELLPLLLLAAHKHPQVKTRDELLHLLFNLVKRPDTDQRRLIVRGFEKMASSVGPSRIEAEILPQLWEQLEHKYPERRLLVAETCSVLVKYLPDSLRSSLILSMLNQLALQDRDLEVKKAAVASTAVLVVHLEDNSKGGQLLDMLMDLLSCNEDPTVIVHVQQTLLTSLALKALKINDGSLTNDLMSTRLLPDLREGGPNLLHKFKLLHSMVPFIVWNVTMNGPFFSGDHETLAFLSCSHQPLEASKDLREYLSREWYESWPGLQWVSEEFAEKLLHTMCANSYDEDDVDILLECVGLFNDLVNHLGPCFARSQLMPVFEQKLPVLGDVEEEEDIKKVYEGYLVPLYVLGVLALVEKAGDVAERLRCLSVVYATYGWDRRPLIAAIKELLIKGSTGSDVRDAMAEMAWSLVVHTSPKVKSLAGVVLDKLAETSVGEDATEDLTAPKILPGLVTLSSDPDPLVRCAAMPGLASVSLSSPTSETREKAAFQLVSFLDTDNEHSHVVTVSAVKSIGKTTSKDSCPHKIRDDLFLPKLSQVCFKYGIESHNEPKLLEMYHALLFDVYMPLCQGGVANIIGSLDDEPPPRLPLPTVQLHVVPCLQKLSAECKRLNALNLEATASGLIGKLEAVHGTAFCPTYATQIPATTTTSSHTTSSLLSASPSMDEMKQKMGKLFQKPSGQPFWKK